MRFGRHPKAFRIALFLFGVTLVLFLTGAIAARRLSRAIHIQTAPGYTTNLDGATYIVHRLPLPQGKVLFKIQKLAALISYVETGQIVETNNGHGSWTPAPSLPTGGFGFGRDPQLLWTPQLDGNFDWRLRIGYTQSLRFSKHHIITLRRAHILTPPLTASQNEKPPTKN